MDVSIFTKLGFSFTVMLLGLCIVFLGLVILIVLIKIMSKIIAAIAAKAEAKKQAAAPAPVVVPEPVAQAAAEETGADEDELVAVITAALMAYAAESGSDKTLVVRNLRKTSAWSKAGRNAQLAARL